MRRYEKWLLLTALLLVVVAALIARRLPASARGRCAQPAAFVFRTHRGLGSSVACLAADAEKGRLASGMLCYPSFHGVDAGADTSGDAPVHLG